MKKQSEVEEDRKSLIDRPHGPLLRDSVFVDRRKCGPVDPRIYPISFLFPINPTLCPVTGKCGFFDESSVVPIMMTRMEYCFNSFQYESPKMLTELGMSGIFSMCSQSREMPYESDSGPYVLVLVENLERLSTLVHGINKTGLSQKRRSEESEPLPRNERRE